MIRPQSDEEFGPFGKAAISILDMLFPSIYRTTLIVNPTFSEIGRANIRPQLERGEFFVLSIIERPEGTGKFISDLSLFSASQDVESLLDRYRYEHAILASGDLGILTAWSQAEYAIVAFREELWDEYCEWFESMQAIEVVRDVRRI